MFVHHGACHVFAATRKGQYVCALRLVEAEGYEKIITWLKTFSLWLPASLLSETLALVKQFEGGSVFKKYDMTKYVFLYCQKCMGHNYYEKNDNGTCVCEDCGTIKEIPGHSHITKRKELDLAPHPI